MSAITGIFYRDGRSVNEEQIKKMNDRLSHRGPDGSAIWCEGPVALGHQMLHTTPESIHEKLPFEEDGLVITADARIDNRKELSEKLEIEDKEEVSDSYFILKSYQKWGERCPEELLGDFSFAIWDKNKEKMFCARDHMGVKPFYYYLSDEVFYFASEIKALLSLPEVSHKLNEVMVADFLVGLFEDREITFYNHILRLPAAHVLILRFEGKSLWQYWKLDPNVEIKMESDEEYSKEFLKIFEESIKCRLRSAFPVGSLLSGGLDSSSIVCTAKKILAEMGRTSLKTFSATFESVPESNEQIYIDKVIEHGHLDPYFIKADQLSPLSNVDDILWHVEEPFFTGNLYIHYYLYKKAQKNGVKVILDGFDGDTTVSHGQRFLIDYLKSNKWIKGLKELYNRSNHTGFSPGLQIFYTLIIPYTPSLIFNFLRLLPTSFPGFMEKFDLINNNLAKKTGIKNRYQKLYEKPFRLSRSSKLFHHFILNQGSYQTVLEIGDKAAAASFLEPRYPFFDRRLIEFCLGLPLEQKIEKGWDRIIMRRAMEDILPSEIQWRYYKTSLAPNFQRNLLEFEKPILENLITKKIDLIENYVDMEVFTRFYKRYDAKKNIELYKFWLGVILVLWMQKISNKHIFI